MPTDPEEQMRKNQRRAQKWFDEVHDLSGDDAKRNEATDVEDISHNESRGTRKSGAFNPDPPTIDMQEHRRSDGTSYYSSGDGGDGGDDSHKHSQNDPTKLLKALGWIVLGVVSIAIGLPVVAAIAIIGACSLGGPWGTLIGVGIVLLFAHQACRGCGCTMVDFEPFSKKPETELVAEEGDLKKKVPDKVQEIRAELKEEAPKSYSHYTTPISKDAIKEMRKQNVLKHLERQKMSPRAYQKLP